MRVELIESWSGVRQLAPEWDDLLERSSADTVFLRWDWLVSWLDVVGCQTTAFVITVRDAEGRLIGAAPLYILEYRLLRIVRYRVLRIMGDYPTGGEYPAWIAERGRENVILDVISRFLQSQATRWDCLWIPNLAGWTRPLEDLTEACLASGFFLRRRKVEFGFTELPGSTEEFLETVSANMRSNLRRQLKKILGQPCVAIERCRDEASLGTFLEALFDLHYRRWQLKGEIGSFRRKPNERRFYSCFAPKALAHGWLRIYALKDHGAIKAIQIGYVYNRVFHLLQEGFDPDYTDGAGNVLRYKVFEDCIRDGIAAYDFLGELSEHKRRWAAKSRVGANIFAGARNGKNALLFLTGVWPTGRYLRPVLSLGTVGNGD